MPFGSSPPVLPPANDAGISPPAESEPAWLRAVGAWLRAIGVGQPIDTLPPVRVDPGGGPVIKVPSALGQDPPGGAPGLGGLDQIAVEIHSAIVGLQEGLPIAGTFALLAVVFLVGLVMFLSESGTGSVISQTAGGAAGAVAAVGERRRKAQQREAARVDAKHTRRDKLHARGESALTKA